MVLLVQTVVRLKPVNKVDRHLTSDKRSDQLSARGRGGKAHAVAAGVRLVDTAERLVLSTLELDP